MLPEQPISFPEFVADQLLTAKNLNDLFHYLDVQERGTRTNLIGIGIVCGLELKVNATGTEIIISRGCGITSQGYLVRWDETRFENYKAYDAAKEIVYPPFFGAGKQKFPIDELKSNSSEEGITKLSKAYLEDKVALLFVELLRNDAKNCDPESCDDKGSNITQTIRPLLVSRRDAVYLTGGVAAGNSFSQGWMSLPELRMPRHHVPATDIFDSGDVFEGFQKELSAAFLVNLEKSLTQTYTRLLPLVRDMHPANPFTGLSGKFAFIHNGTMTVQQLLYMQYYYDLFSDVIFAYEELRRSGMKLLSLCCPDENLFPRHLLLGFTGDAPSKVKLDFRHYFIPSPAVCCHRDLVGEIRLFFRRLVLLLERFLFDESAPSNFNNNAIALLNRAVRQLPIRITPSKLGDVPLSEKAIPFYYDVASGTDKLFQHWSYGRSMQGNADQNLSYHADQYNTGDDAVLRPLHYDLEPYNFLRIEGHVGRRYTDALATINQIRDTNRLPFDVVALSADIRSLREMLAAIANSTNYANLREGFAPDITVGCHFQDLEALYDTMAQGLLCNLCKEMKYYYDNPKAKDNQAADLVPQVPLLKKCDPAFRYRAGTLGDRFEQFYKTVANQPYITAQQFLAGQTGNNILNIDNRAFTVFLPFLALMYFIEKLSEILPTTLISFNIVAFQRRYADLLTIAQHIKKLYEDAADNNPDSTVNGAELMAREDFLDHLDALLFACQDARFSALYNDYKVRWVYLAMMQKLGYYVRMHPGIQHKAGVSMGGTFILVYHERSRLRQGNANIFTRDIREATALRRTDTVVPGAGKAEEDPPGIRAKAKAGKEAEPAPETDEAAADEAKSALGIDGLKASNAAYASVHHLQTSKLKASLTQKQMAIIDKLFFKDLITRHSLDELTAQLPDRIVIADFYLPYMCCSDCPPVYYIVNEKPDEEPDRPTVTIKDTQYCGADKAAYPVTVSPSGGSFGNSEGITEANGAFSFNPAAVNIPENTLNKIVALTYTKDGQSASVNVTVFAKPQAAFDIIPATTYNFFVFANKSLRAASVVWDFGDGITATGDNPSHAYPVDGTYTVTLRALNGVCSDTATQTINVVRASVAIDGKEFCSADKSLYPVQVSPQGGEVTGEGISKQATGFVFSPGSVSFAAGQGSKDVFIAYSLPGQVVQTSVKVFRTPSAAFTVSSGAAAPNIRIFKTANDFPAQYSWEFGDGNKSVEPAPAHQYKEGGRFSVSVRVTNGPCRAEDKQEVVVNTENPRPEKSCGPLDAVISSFKDLRKINANLHKAFTNIYEPYGEIEELFKKLGDIAGDSPAAQLKALKEADIAGRMLKWFTELNPLVQNSDVRVIAIALWRVLTDLAMYIVCIQDTDFDKAEIPMNSLFSRIAGFIKGWNQFVPNFSAADKAQLQQLLNHMSAERDRVSKNGEDTIKSKYFNALKTIIDMLAEYLK